MVIIENLWQKSWNLSCLKQGINNWESIINIIKI